MAGDSAPCKRGTISRGGIRRHKSLIKRGDGWRKKGDAQQRGWRRQRADLDLVGLSDPTALEARYLVKERLAFEKSRPAFCEA